MPEREPPLHYSHLGLSLELPFAARRLRAPHSTQREADVRVRLASLPPELQIGLSTVRHVRDNHGFLFDAPDIGRFWVPDARSVVIEAHPGASESDLELVLFSEALASLLWQRQEVPLHANAVSINGRGLLITGPSGAGKSTLCAQLVARGGRLIADDFCRTVPEPSPNAWHLPPGGQTLMLWQDQLSTLPNATATKLRPGLDKYAAALDHNQLVDSTTALAGIVVLAEGRDTLEIERLDSKSAFNALHELIFRPDYARTQDERTRHFSLLAELALAIPVLRITRPGNADTGPQTAEAALRFLDSTG